MCACTCACGSPLKSTGAGTKQHRVADCFLLSLCFAGHRIRQNPCVSRSCGGNVAERPAKVRLTPCCRATLVASRFCLSNTCLMHKETQSDTHTHTHRHTHTPTYTPTYTNTHTHTHQRTHTPTHTPTYTHTRAQSSWLQTSFHLKQGSYESWVRGAEPHP